MSVSVYRKGITHTEHGIKCEKLEIQPTKLRKFLKAGWKLSPQQTVGVRGFFSRKAKMPVED